MSERDFELSGKKFKLNKIDAFKQFHIVRRMSPLLGDLLPVLGEISKAQSTKKFEDFSESEKFDEIAKVAAPILTSLSKLSDQDADKVLLGLLSSIEMQQPTGNWARMANDSGIMIELDLPILLQAAGRAFVFNLSGFITVLPQNS